VPVPRSLPEPADSSLRRARRLLTEYPLVDGHNDLAWALRETGLDLAGADLATRGTRTQTDLARLRDGGVGAQFWSVYVPSTLPDAEAVRQTLEQIDLVSEMVCRFPDHLALAGTAEEVHSVFSSGRIASLLGAEGGHCIGGSLAILRVLYRLGVRYLTLTHNHSTTWADSATDEPVSGGLNAFGRSVVREMNRLGMLVDLSHVSPATMHAALDVSRAPVIMSHSSCRALVDHPRNVGDDVLRRLPRNGGVVMICLVPDFVSNECRTWTEGVRRSMRARGLDDRDLAALDAASAQHAVHDPKPRATVAQVADHIEHARDVAGIDHLGIGGDYDGCPDFPVGLEDVSGYPLIFAELLNRGWADSALARLAGGNVLRALHGAEQVAARFDSGVARDCSQ